MARLPRYLHFWVGRSAEALVALLVLGAIVLAWWRTG